MLIKTIKEKLTTQDISSLHKKVGYNTSKKFIETLDKLISTNSIYDWIYSGHYDLVYNSKDFLTKLCEVLDISKSLLNDEINKAVEYCKEEERFKSSYIFINTNFKRKSEPIFALALCEKFRNISLYKKEDLLFKSIKEILDILSNQIKSHYEENIDKLSIWGKIVSYQVHLFDKTYVFDINGKLREDENEVFESKATISINNKEFISKIF